MFNMSELQGNNFPLKYWKSMETWKWQ